MIVGDGCNWFQLIYWGIDLVIGARRLMMTINIPLSRLGRYPACAAERALGLRWSRWRGNPPERSIGGTLRSQGPFRGSFPLCRSRRRRGWWGIPTCRLRCRGRFVRRFWIVLRVCCGRLRRSPGCLLGHGRCLVGRLSRQSLGRGISSGLCGWDCMIVGFGQFRWYRLGFCIPEKIMIFLFWWSVFVCEIAILI